MLLSKSQRKSLTFAKTLARCFEVRVTVKLFGRVILDYKWPPDDDTVPLSDVDVIV